MPYTPEVETQGDTFPTDIKDAPVSIYPRLFYTRAPHWKKLNLLLRLGIPIQFDK